MWLWLELERCVASENTVLKAKSFYTDPLFSHHRGRLCCSLSPPAKSMLLGQRCSIPQICHHSLVNSSFNLEITPNIEKVNRQSQLTLHRTKLSCWCSPAMGVYREAVRLTRRISTPRRIDDSFRASTETHQKAMPHFIGEFDLAGS